MNALRILIADDHEVVRQGLRALIENEPGWEVCGTATTGREAVERAQELKPDIALLDMTMPELSGLEATRQIKRALPLTEVLIFSAARSEDVVAQVFDAGAKSYICKADAGRHLVAAIHSLAAHKPFFTTEVSEILFSRFLAADARRANGATEQKLTAREREIVRLLAEGRSNKETADLLGISIRTSETHRASLMRKLSLDSLPALVRYAIRNQIIEA
jgi:DNA-binding NarL/FixJ family response regulator